MARDYLAIFESLCEVEREQPLAARAAGRRRGDHVSEAGSTKTRGSNGARRAAACDLVTTPSPPRHDEDELLEHHDTFYIQATSSRTDDRTRVLKHGDTFGVFDRFGDVQPVGLGEQGLYDDGTRFLSRLELRVGGRRPLLLSSTVRKENDLLAVDLSNPDLKDKSGDADAGARRAARLSQQVPLEETSVTSGCESPASDAIRLPST